MEKIPTIFERDERGKVVDQCSPGCAWVLSGEGIATEKLDGTNVRLTVRSDMIVRVEKRRNPTRIQKECGIREPWYVDATIEDPVDKWIMASATGTNVDGWPDGEHCCEAIGPKLQGNPLGVPGNICVPFNMTRGIPIFGNVVRTFDALKAFLQISQSLYSPGHHLIEGIVFHHGDGRRAKIKRKDFF